MIAGAVSLFREVPCRTRFVEEQPGILAVMQRGRAEFTGYTLSLRSNLAVRANSAIWNACKRRSRRSLGRTSHCGDLSSPAVLIASRGASGCWTHVQASIWARRGLTGSACDREHFVTLQDGCRGLGDCQRSDAWPELEMGSPCPQHGAISSALQA